MNSIHQSLANLDQAIQEFCAGTVPRLQHMKPEECDRVYRLLREKVQSARSSQRDDFLPLCGLLGFLVLGRYLNEQETCIAP